MKVSVSKAISGAVSRLSRLSNLDPNQLVLASAGHGSWDGNWADWSDDGHNDWSNWAPEPPGGK